MAAWVEDPLGTNSHQTIQRVKQMLTPDWAQKNETNHVHNGYCLAILVQFVHQGCASACMGNFHFDNYKPCPFQNTVEKPETKTCKMYVWLFQRCFSKIPA